MLCSWAAPSRLHQKGNSSNAQPRHAALHAGLLEAFYQCRLALLSRKDDTTQVCLNSNTQSSTMQAHLGVLQRPQKHFIESQGVCPIAVHHIIWVDHVAPALAHLVCPCREARLRILAPHQLVSLLLDFLSIHPAGAAASCITFVASPWKSCKLSQLSLVLTLAISCLQEQQSLLHSSAAAKAGAGPQHLFGLFLGLPSSHICVEEER